MHRHGYDASPHHFAKNLGFFFHLIIKSDTSTLDHISSHHLLDEKHGIQKYFLSLGVLVNQRNHDLTRLTSQEETNHGHTNPRQTRTWSQQQYLKWEGISQCI